MRQVNLIEFSDLLFEAQALGHDWNTAHNIILKDIWGSFPRGMRDVYRPSKYPDECARWADVTKAVVEKICIDTQLSWFTVKMDD